MNMQEAFDRAAAGVLQQKVPSIDQSGDCLYISKGGFACCGVGHLLVDDDMRERWDAKTWTIYDLMSKPEVLEKAKPDMKRAGIDQLPLKFLHALQDAHDLSSSFDDFIPQFKEQMQQVAKEWNLNAECVA